MSMRRMQQFAHRHGALTLASVLLVVMLPGCLAQPGQGFGAAGMGPVPRMAASPARGGPPALQPRPVNHQGQLTPATQIAGVLPGNTVVITQPWVGLNRFELRETPIYFAADRRTFSRDWAGIPWSAQANQVCMTRNQTSKCYTAYTDATQQAYLRDEVTGLLARVTSIEPGDSRRVQAEFQARLEQNEARNELTMMFVGLLAEGLLSGGLGGGGGGGQQERIIEYTETRTGSSGGGMTARPISSFYGSCHNPMGC